MRDTAVLPCDHCATETITQPAQVTSANNSSRLLNRLYRDCHKELRNLIHRIVNGGPPDPEDVVQEAFTALARMDNLTQLDDPKAYVYRIAINVSHRSISHQVKTRDYLTQQVDGLEESRDDCSPERIAVSQQFVERVTAGLNRLTHKQRQLVIMSRIQGMTYEQIQHTTGWSLADISRQLNQALETLIIDSGAEL